MLIESYFKLPGGQGRQNSCLGKDSLERKNKTASNELNYKNCHIRIFVQSSIEGEKWGKNYLIFVARGYN